MASSWEQSLSNPEDLLIPFVDTYLQRCNRGFTCRATGVVALWLMQFLTSGEIGKALSDVLKNAVSVSVASAFFSPGSETLSTLKFAKNLTLVISEEFTINNPNSLEQLTSAVVRSVPTDSKDGKLHAKVFIAEPPDGSD